MVGYTYENEELNKDKGRRKKSRGSSPGTVLRDGTFDKRTTRPGSPWSNKAREASAFPRSGDRKRERNVGRVDFHGRMEGIGFIASSKGKG